MIQGIAYILLGVAVAAIGARDIVRSRDRNSRHVHHCPRCDVAWAHKADPNRTHAEHIEAHRCPVCKIPVDVVAPGDVVGPGVMS